MRIITPLLIAIFAVAIGSVSSTTAQRERPGDREVRPAKYSFPTALSGVDFGRSKLVALVKDTKLDAETLTERLTNDLPLSGVARLVRIMGAEELNALSREVGDGNLAGLVRQSSSARHLAKLMDDAGIRDNSVVRAMRKVFEDFYNEEFAAYWVRHGLGENFLLSRLAASPERKYPERLRNLDDLNRRENDRPDRLWEDFRPADHGLSGDAHAHRVALWLGIPSRITQTELEYIFKEERLVLTPDIRRVLDFGDSQLAAKALKVAGLSNSALTERVRERLRELKDTAAAREAQAILARFDNLVELQEGWLYGGGAKIKAIYSGSSAGGLTPILGTLEGDGSAAAELPDLGISQSILTYFSRTPDILLVHFEGDLVRAKIGTTRLEGKFDPSTGRLDMIAPYGGSERKFASHAVHSGGLLLELEQELAPDRRSKLLLRRIAGW